MNKKVYLCGAIQDMRDGGVRWRDRLTPKLEELGWTVLDPCKSEANLADGTVTDAKEIMSGWISAGHWEKFMSHMRRVRETDMDMVRDSDLLIVHLDFSRKIGGTICEMWDAFMRHIPIYVMTYDPAKDWNHWILSMVKDGGAIFDSWSSLLEAVDEKWGNR